jgi:hypothetical protein
MKTYRGVEVAPHILHGSEWSGSRSSRFSTVKRSSELNFDL